MDLVRQAHALTQQGDLQGAARICRQILAGQPMHDYALYLLGAIEAQNGNLAEATKFFGLAVRANPRSAEAMLAYGGVLVDAKRPREAADALTLALALAPNNANAHILRGTALAETGKHDEALADFDRALKIEPRSPAALHAKAHLLITLKRYGEARESIGKLLRAAPDFLPGYLTGIAAANAGKNYADAAVYAEKALALAPGNAELWHSKGFALHRLGKRDEAFSSYAKAVSLDPKMAGAFLNGANLLMEMQRLPEALRWIEGSIRADPKSASGHVLRGNILLHLLRRDEALKSYDTALAIAPNDAEAHYHRGSLLFLEGQFQKGFADFEFRWQVQDCGFDRPALAAPEWRGEDVTGKKLIVYSEQGMGDTIQFARFLPILARKGAYLTFLCHPNLILLLGDYLRGIEIVGVCENDRHFDYQCALMSVPHWLGTHPNAIPDAKGYLAADAARVALWREKIGSHGLKAGIAWQGNPRGAIDHGRSIPLEKFLPLMQVPGVRLISLQKVHGLDQLERLPPGMTVETLADVDRGEDAFLDTAAIMMCLDVVVTSDTAIAHLAGALGVPAFVALKKVPDWRWMMDREDSPWYGSLRLFRQETAGDWDGVFARIKAELSRLAAEKAMS
jgi:tetratricopeptide (TPR) repeat protein